MQENLTFKDVYQLPLEVDKYSIYAFCSNGVKALTFTIRENFIKEAVVNSINENQSKFEPKWTRSGNSFYYQDNLIFIIRGWGYLVGVGGLNLSNEKAAEIQEEFGQYILECLNNQYEK